MKWNYKLLEFNGARMEHQPTIVLLLASKLKGLEEFEGRRSLIHLQVINLSQQFKVRSLFSFLYLQ